MCYFQVKIKGESQDESGEWGEKRGEKCVTDTAIKRKKMCKKKVESLKEGFKVKQGKMIN